MAYGYSGPTTAPGASVNSIIDRIRQQRADARALAAEERKAKTNIGKGIMKFDSSLRAWQMARVAKPDLSYGEFIMNPVAAGVYQKAAATEIMAGRAEMPKMMSLKRYTDLFKGKGKGDVDIKKELTKKPEVKKPEVIQDQDTSPLYEGAFRSDPTDVPSTFGSGDELVYPRGTKQRFLGQGSTQLTRHISGEKADSLGKVPDPETNMSKIFGKIAEDERLQAKSDAATVNSTRQVLEPGEDGYKVVEGPGQDIDPEELQALLAEPFDLTDAEGKSIGSIDPEKTEGLKGMLQRAIPGGESGYEATPEGTLTALEDADVPGQGKVWGQSIVEKASQDEGMVDIKDHLGVDKSKVKALGDDLEFPEEVIAQAQSKADLDPEKIKKLLSEPMPMVDAEGNSIGNLEPKKTEGLKGMFQRAVPGGKTGYRSRTEQELKDRFVKKEKPIAPQIDADVDLPDDIEDVDVDAITDAADIETGSIGELAGKAGELAGGIGALNTLYNADPSDIELGDVKAGMDVAKIGAKGAAEMGSKGGAALGQTLGKAAPWVSVAMSVNTLADKKSTDMQKTGALMSAAGAIAMTNFWNPAGWVAGALTVGGTLATLFGGKAQKPKRSVRAATGYRGGSGYSYV